jgi:hypothetical protein
MSIFTWALPYLSIVYLQITIQLRPQDNLSGFAQCQRYPNTQYPPQSLGTCGMAIAAVLSQSHVIILQSFNHLSEQRRGPNSLGKGPTARPSDGKKARRILLQRLPLLLFPLRNTGLWPDCSPRTTHSKVQVGQLSSCRCHQIFSIPASIHCYAILGSDYPSTAIGLQSFYTHLNSQLLP